MGAEGFSLALFLDYFISSISSDGAGTLGDFPLLHYFRNYEIKNTDLIQFFWFLQAILNVLLIGVYVDATLACTTQL